MAKVAKRSIKLDTKTLEIRDLSDFCLHWNEIRPLVEDASSKNAELTDDQRTSLYWLTELAERVCKFENPI